MSDFRAFNPTGPTILVPSDAAAPAGVQALSPDGDTNQYRIYNASAAVVHVAHGIDAATAQARAVIPTGGGANAKHSYPVGAGQAVILSAPKAAFWSSISAAAASVFITPGRGL